MKYRYLIVTITVHTVMVRPVAIYKQYAPLVNVCRKPGEWQTYDIIYTAPTFGNDSTIFILLHG